MKKIFKNYSFYFKTGLIPFATPDYTQQNLKFNLLALLNECEMFNKLKEIYQSYKIRFVTFKAMPRYVNGTAPKPCYIYLDTQDLLNFNYTAIPTLQRSKILSTKRNQTIKLKSQGRQDDFNYWFDTTDGPNASIRLRSEAEPTNQVYWMFQIGFAIVMRGMVLPIQEETVKEQQVGLPTQQKKNRVPREDYEKIVKLPDLNLDIENNSVENENENKCKIIINRLKNFDLNNKNIDIDVNQASEFQNELREINNKLNQIYIEKFNKNINLINSLEENKNKIIQLKKQKGEVIMQQPISDKTKKIQGELDKLKKEYEQKKKEKREFKKN
jgi:hypothetical protein